jgi:hypothetical protein
MGRAGPSLADALPCRAYRLGSQDFCGFLKDFLKPQV